MRTASSNPGLKLPDALLHQNWWEWWDEIITFLIWVTFSKSKRQKKLRMYFVLLFLSLLATWINPLLVMKVLRPCSENKSHSPIRPLCLQVEERMSGVKSQVVSSPGCAGFSSKVSWCRYQIIKFSNHLPTMPDGPSTGLMSSTSRWQREKSEN